MAAPKYHQLAGPPACWQPAHGLWHPPPARGPLTLNSNDAGVCVRQRIQQLGGRGSVTYHPAWQRLPASVPGLRRLEEGAEGCPKQRRAQAALRSRLHLAQGGRPCGCAGMGLVVVVRQTWKSLGAGGGSLNFSKGKARAIFAAVPHRIIGRPAGPRKKVAVLTRAVSTRPGAARRCDYPWRRRRSLPSNWLSAGARRAGR